PRAAEGEVPGPPLATRDGARVSEAAAGIKKDTVAASATEAADGKPRSAVTANNDSLGCIAETRGCCGGDAISAGPTDAVGGKNPVRSAARAAVDPAIGVVDAATVEERDPGATGACGCVGRSTTLAARDEAVGVVDAAAQGREDPVSAL